MKETKLLSMCEFVQMQDAKFHDMLDLSTDLADVAIRNKLYCDFLQTPLELKRFVACKDGVPMVKPYECDCNHTDESDTTDMECQLKCEFDEDYAKEYKEALKDVWFEGFALERSIYEGIYTLNLNGKFWDTLDFKKRTFNLVRRQPFNTEMLAKENPILTPSKANDLGLTKE